MDLNDLTTICKQRRKEKGLTQSELGKLINLPKERISEFENNKANLQCDTLLKLLTALELEITPQ